MLAQFLSPGIYNFAGQSGKSLAEKGAIVFLRDKADILAGFGCCGQPCLLCHLFCLVSAMLAQRKQDAAELLLGQSVEKIGLGPAGIYCLEQAMAVAGMLYSSVMACSQVIGSQGERCIEQEAKLYVLVAGHAGIRGPPSLEFPAEVVHHTGLEFLLQVKLMVGNV